MYSAARRKAGARRFGLIALGLVLRNVPLTVTVHNKDRAGGPRGEAAGLEPRWAEQEIASYGLASAATQAVGADAEVDRSGI